MNLKIKLRVKMTPKKHEQISEQMKQYFKKRKYS